jgi:hypothetical protein
MDQRPRAIKTRPVQNGSLRDNPASQSSPCLAGGKSTATTRGRDRAKPNIPREINPLKIAPPAAPLAAAVPNNAKIKGPAQAGILKANSRPRPTELPLLERRDKLGPNDTARVLDLPVKYITPINK